MKNIIHYFKDFVSLFFPDLCAGCGTHLFTNEHNICLNCIFHLPRTNFHLDPENKVARSFWGRIPCIHAGAFLYFQKGNKVQHLIHQLKYNNKPETGFKLGELYGYDLKKDNHFKDIDLIIPVPLHSKRVSKRGYNQSEKIANGLGSVLGIPVSSEHLVRNMHTETQTKKSRFERYKNMKDAFHIQKSQELKNKHVLLLDDVITTGATLEACALALLSDLKEINISIASIAIAE